MLSYVLKFISMWSHWKTRQLSVLGAAIVTYTSFLKLNVSTDKDSDARDWWRTKSGGKTRSKSEGHIFFPHDDKVLPVETHSFCRLARSLRCWSFKSSGAVHTTSDTVALVLLSHDISHLARQSHSKALPRRSLQENKRQEVAKRPHKERKTCVTQTRPTALWESPSRWKCLWAGT